MFGGANAQPENKGPTSDKRQNAEQKNTAQGFDTSSLERAIRESIKDASEKPDPHAEERLKIDRQIGEYTRKLAEYTDKLSSYTLLLAVFTAILAFVAIW